MKATLKNAVRQIGSRFGLLSSTERTWNTREFGPDHYDRVYLAPDKFEDIKGPYWQSYYYFIWAVIADRVRRANARRVFEVGCGPGRLGELLLEQGIESFVGFDFSPVAVEIARQRLPQARFEVDDARHSRLYRELDYDLIICTEVLEHVEDDLEIVSRFPSGKRCLCSVPNFPYDGHVRHFQTAADVHTRYSPFFLECDVMTLRSPLSESARFYLLEGIRNNYVVTPSAPLLEAVGGVRV